MLFVGLGRVEMGAGMELLREGLEEIKAHAEELEAAIAANVAEILER
jgi:hypothetical protein